MNAPTKPLSRRTFLKMAGAGAAGLSTAGLGVDTVWANDLPPANDESWSILIDLTRCTGCNSCVVACQAVNQQLCSAEPPTRLSSDSYTFVDVRHVAGQDASQFVKRQCMHCLEPACVSACTVGALQKTAAGPVIYNAERCIGCRYCQYACPFGVPTYDWGNALGLIHKCRLCTERLAQDELPACVDACPNGALHFGQRAAMLAQAQAHIASEPERYIDHIYGQHEAGGTAVLYLSDLPFEQLGFPQLGPEPIPRYAEAVMRQTPVVALSVAAVATSLHWITHRRQKLSRQAEAADSTGGDQ